MYLLLVLALALVAALLGRHIWRDYVFHSFSREPPLVTSVVPFLGCAIEFGKGPPAAFIQKCRERYGGVFTLHVAGRRMTFLLEPRHYELYFTAPEEQIDFANATQPFLSRGFGVPRQEYFDFHTASLLVIRNALSPLRLRDYVVELEQSFAQHCSSRLKREGECNLQEEIRHCVFWCSLTCLLGDSVKQHPDLLARFESFDSLFELASSEIPQSFLPSFTSAKRYLLRALNSVARECFNANQKPGQVRGVLARLLLEGVKTSTAESWLLSIMWAAEANTIPMIFWVIVYLLQNPEYLKTVKHEIEEISNMRNLTYEDYDKFANLKNAIKETIRLRSSPIILRKSMQDLEVDNYIIPAGDFLCLSPLWSHRDQTLFENPDVWMPSRWNTMKDNSEATSRYAFIAFGSGKYRCPGQYFAFLEISILVSHLICRFNMQLIDKVPEPDMNNLVGVLKPKEDCRIRYTRL